MLDKSKVKAQLGQSSLGGQNENKDVHCGNCSLKM